MSTFRQLMMRKKEETLYPVIKGSLTESPEGVFSGFSGTNYLSITEGLNITQNDTFEFVFNFTLDSNFGDSNTICGNNTPILALVKTSGIQYYGSSLGISGQMGTNVLISGQNYWIKMKYDKTSFNSYISTNGKDWILDYTKSISSATYSITGAFHICQNSSSQYLKGSMNLNKSYIKINSTKYKLQAVVGYTVVGSPTESPSGVFSGFSSANYLTIPETNLDLKNTVFHCKFKTGNDLTTPQSIMQFGRTGQTLPMLFYIDSNKAWCFYSGKNTGANAYTRIEIILSANTEYEIEFGTKNTKRYLQFGLVGNMQNISLTSGTDEDWNGSIARTTYFGNAGTSLTTAFSGSIDLNNTYIKINNKLWFNGQEA